MKIRCEYCEQYIDDTEEVCPHCGAVNPSASRAANGVPRTVEELKAFAARHNLPLAKMRVFLGENYTGPRAYGIYRDEDSGEFVVYKNKSDGSRAVRYSGHDEAYAVNELYQKMKSEVAEQKSRIAAQKSGSRQSSYAAPRSRGSSAFTDEERRRDLERRFGIGQGYESTSPMSGILRLLSRLFLWVGRIFVVGLGIMVALVVLGGIVTFFLDRGSGSTPSGGYYQYEDTTYYPWHGDWYYWDDGYSDWYETDPPSDFTDHYDDYFVTDSYYDYDGFNDGFDSFYNSSVYQDYSDSYDSDYDSGSSWSSSWDDDDDWDTDWDDDDWDWDSDDDWDSDWSDWDDDW